MFKKIMGRILADLKQFWLVILLVAIIWILVDTVAGGVCPVPLITGFPCPGCGMTRAVFYLLQGNWAASWGSNPTALLWLAGGAYFFFMRYIAGKKAPGIGIYMVIVAVVTMAVYIYRMYTMFPGEEPLVYHTGNLIEKLLRGYRQLK